MFVERLGGRRPNSRSRFPKLLAAGVVFVVAGLGLAVPSFAAQAANAPASPVIIGLGDSFTSGVGESTLDPKSGICRRSAQSYPLVAARSLGVTGANAACSGATVSAFTDSFRGQLPQNSKIGDAKYVVMTMGGNDILSLANATNLVTDQAKFQQALSELAPQLKAGYTSVKTEAPSAHILVLAYPDLFPATDTGTCTAAITPLLATLHQATAALNGVVKDQSTAAGLQFIDTSKTFSGHDICAQDPWATGISDPNIALHPNDKGHVALASAVTAAIKPLMSGTAPTNVSTGAVTDTSQPPVVAPDVLSQQPAADPNDAVIGSDTAVLGASESAQGDASNPVPTAPTQTAPAAATPTLAYTGMNTSATLSLGCALMALGLGLIWLRLRLVHAQYAYVDASY